MSREASTVDTSDARFSASEFGPFQKKVEALLALMEKEYGELTIVASFNNKNIRTFTTNAKTNKSLIIHYVLSKLAEDQFKDNPRAEAASSIPFFTPEQLSTFAIPTQTPLTTTHAAYYQVMVPYATAPQLVADTRLLQIVDSLENELVYTKETKKYGASLTRVKMHLAELGGGTSAKDEAAVEAGRAKLKTKHGYEGIWTGSKGIAWRGSVLSLFTAITEERPKTDLDSLIRLFENYLNPLKLLGRHHADEVIALIHNLQIIKSLYGADRHMPAGILTAITQKLQALYNLFKAYHAESSELGTCFRRTLFALDIILPAAMAEIDLHAYENEPVMTLVQLKS